MEKISFLLTVLTTCCLSANAQLSGWLLNKDNIATPQDTKVSVWSSIIYWQQPRGKQVKVPEGTWYTPVTGIWQIVWLKGVAKIHIEATKKTIEINDHTQYI